MKLAVILVHGIGDQKEGWAEGIIASLKNKVHSKLKSILKEIPPSSMDEVLVVEGAYWANLFQKRQEKLRSILDKFVEGSVKTAHFEGSFWVKLAKFLFFIVSQLLKGIQGVVVSDYVGDVIGYLHKPSQELVHLRVTETLEFISKQYENSSQKIPLTFISHSLGTVISSNYIYDACKIRKPIKDGFSDIFRLDNFFTIGSPIALFAVRYEGPEAFGDPIHVEGTRGRWINISDPDDPVGMPLKPLNVAYKDAVFKDVTVDAGIYGVAHTEYFNKTETLSIVANKLAIDWVALNGKLPQSDIDGLYSEYDKDFLVSS